MTGPEALRWAASVLPAFDPASSPPPRDLPGAGSERRLSRLFLPGASVILVENPLPPSPGPDENDSFVYLSAHLRERGLPVPEVLAYHRETGVYLMEDLGDEDLFQAVAGGLPEKGLRRLYGEAVLLLARMQVRGREGFDPGRCHSPSRYDRDLMLNWESGYFHRELLAGHLGLGPPAPALAGEYRRLAARAEEAGADFFLHRDFQSMNLKVRDGRLWIIDFQGARLGPPQYDLAALLYDPYVDLPERLREALLEEYLEAFLPQSGLARGLFLSCFPAVAAHRLMQALGAFAFLGLRRGKPRFLAFIPAALRLLGEILRRLPSDETVALREHVSLARERYEGGEVRP